MNFKILLGLIVGCTCAAGNAASWTDSGEVTEIYLHSSYNGLFVKKAVIENPDACPTVDMYFLSKNNQHYKELYSLLLAARLANQKVRLYVDGCQSSRPLIQHVKM